MAWLRLDDGYARHRKVRRRSDAAFRLHTTAMCFCGHDLTDGVVTLEDIQEMPGINQRQLMRRISELCDANLWEEHGRNAWLVHDYLDYNPSRVEVMEGREQARNRQKRWKEKRSEHSNNGVGDALPTPPPPDPSPPDPSPSSSHLENKGGSKQREDKHPPQPCGRNHDTATPCGACGLARKSAKDDDTSAAKARSKAKSSAAKAQAAETHRKIAACDDCDEKGYTSGRKVCHHQYAKEEA